MPKFDNSTLKKVDIPVDFCKTDRHLKEITAEIRKGLPISEILKKEDRHVFFELISPLRENVLNWYPFSKDETILEIGGDGGAITGMLSERVKRVVSIEFSETLGEMSYFRHHKKENLEILTGNPLSLVFNSFFDVIIINDSLLFSKWFCDDEEPDLNLLKHVKRLLKPSGKILIIAENCLGLQYFNGKPNRFSGLLFEDIEGEHFSGLKEYNLIELQSLIERSGFLNQECYYLEPDIKHVQGVYHESSYNSSYNHYRNYSGKKRFSFFDETRVLSVLDKNGLADKFINGFLIEANNGEKKKDDWKVLYSKISSERKPEYRIATRIEEHPFSGEKKVVKVPTNHRSIAHLQAMVGYYEKNHQIGSFQNAPCQLYKDGQGIEFPFFNDKNFEEKLVSLLKKGNQEQFVKLIHQYKTMLFDDSKEKEFFGDEAFSEVFGNEKIDGIIHCIPVTNIDLIFSNIFEDQQKYYVIDYEWVFDFDIPLEYVFWRAILYLYQGNSIVRDHYSIESLLKLGNIRSELQEVFYKWEFHFVFQYVSDSMFRLFGEKVENIRNELQNSIEKYYSSTLFCSSDHSWEVKNEIIKQYKMNDNNFHIEFNDDEKSHEYIRWRPANQPCRVRIKEVYTDLEKEVYFSEINALDNENGWQYFVTKDPLFEIICYEKNWKTMTIIGEMECLTPTETVDLANRKISRDAQKIEKYEQLFSGTGIIRYYGKKSVERILERRKILGNSFQSIKYRIDEVNRFDRCVRIRGWAFDLLRQEDVDVTLMGKNRKMKIERKERKDIDEFYGLKPGLKPGFEIEIKEDMSPKSINFLRFKNSKGSVHYAVVELAGKLSGFSRTNQKYKKWIQENEKKKMSANAKNKMQAWAYQPLISIIMPVYNVEIKFLDECIRSLKNQWYTNWELCIADDCSTRKEIRRYLEKTVKENPNIHCVFREKNGHISRATNDAASIAKGEIIGLMDDDDLLAPFALYRVVETLNHNRELDLIYSDEDKVTEKGKRKDPFFKPDWSPDTLLSQNYLCHFTVIRKTLFDQTGGMTIGLEGAQDHDLFLKCVEKTDKIGHIPEILYHWRESNHSTAKNMSSKNYAVEAGMKAVQNALVRRGKNGTVSFGKSPGTYIVNYLPVGEPKVSIIIPTKDHASDLKKCVESIIEKAGYDNWEILIVDNGSKEKETFSFFKEYENRYEERIRVLPLDIPFNFSELNNRAAEQANGEFLLLMNNDIEMITENWMSIMIGYAQQPHIGAVGAKLYYPDNTIQHAGVVLGIGGVAGHSHKYFDRREAGYYSRLRIPSNYAGVTAALMMVEKQKFFEVNGLNEKELKVAFNDVDLNLKLLKKGYYNVCLSQVEAFHYESKSRGIEDTPEKQKRFQKEVNYMLTQWGDLLKQDPYYSRHLTLKKEDFSMDISMLPESFENNLLIKKAKDFYLRNFKQM